MFISTKHKIWKKKAVWKLMRIIWRGKQFRERERFVVFITWEILGIFESNNLSQNEYLFFFFTIHSKWEIFFCKETREEVAWVKSIKIPLQNWKSENVEIFIFSEAPKKVIFLSGSWRSGGWLVKKSRKFYFFDLISAYCVFSSSTVAVSVPRVPEKYW